MSLFTVFGGNGFIGSEFVKEIKERGHEVFIPSRDDELIFTKNLGIVIYAAGYGDCAKDPFNVLDANTILLSNILRFSSFDRLVYLSSTRVYMNHNSSIENSNLVISKNDNRKLFNLTKLTAEELCIRSQKNCLIIRPSNVYGLALGSNLFLPSIIRDAVIKSEVNMYISRDYSKDYISVNDVVEATLRLIELDCIPNIINIGYGKNVDAASIANILHEETQCKINWIDQKYKSCEVFPDTNNLILRERIIFNPRFVLNDLRFLINEFKNEIFVKINPQPNTLHLNIRSIPSAESFLQ